MAEFKVYALLFLNVFFFRSTEVQKDTVDLSLDTSLSHTCLSPGGVTQTSKLEPSDCCSVVSQYSVALFVPPLYVSLYEFVNEM